jgi:acyl carrier protein
MSAATPPPLHTAPGTNTASDAAALRAALQECLAALAPEARLDAIDPQASLRAQLDLDSYDFLQLLIALHERLGVDVPESAYASVDSVERLLGFLSAGTQARAAP